MNAADLSPAVRLKLAGDAISERMADIAGFFVPGTKLTLLARQPDQPDGSRDMVLTDDDLCAVISALKIRKAAGAR